MLDSRAKSGMWVRIVITLLESQSCTSTGKESDTVKFYKVYIAQGEGISLLFGIRNEIGIVPVLD